MIKKRRGEYKQMAFETAIRNPERYKGIMEKMLPFEGEVLNDEMLLEIVCSLYIEGEVSSDRILVKDNTSIDCIKELVKDVNITRNSDGGFPKGYQSRFWTYMRTLSELGFVYARYNKEFKISALAKMLLNNEIDEQEAFSIQAVKYNRKSPYRRVLNNFNYFEFILKVLLKLNDESKALSYEQFVVSLFSTDGDAEKFIALINGISLPDNDAVYVFVSNHYPKTANKKGEISPHNHQTILRDYPDVVLRLLRITGFINIVYNGKTLIKINSDKLVYIQQLLQIKYYMSEEEKSDEMKFYNKMNYNLDAYLKVALSFRSLDKIDGCSYANKLDEVVRMYSIDEEKISKYILHLNDKQLAPEFKYISDPLKLEFYISILIFIKYGKKYAIRPNYKIDSLGMPISHAPGNIGDIEVYNSTIYWLVEVTLIRNKTQQMNNETTSVVRHLCNSDEFMKHKENYLSLVAPIIHEDTKRFLDFSIIDSRKEELDVYIKPYNLSEFIEITKERKNCEDMKMYCELKVEEFKSKLFS